MKHAATKPLHTLSASELEQETQEFLEQSSHMQILGNGQVSASETSLSAAELRQTIETAVIESRVGDLLRQARLQRGLTGEQAGALIGVKRARVSQMESNGDVLQLQNLVQYAQSLGFDVQLSFVPRGEGSVLSRELH